MRSCRSEPTFMETVQKPPMTAGRLLEPFTSPGKAWGHDLAVIAAAWLTVRIPLIAWGVPPLIQCDSLCYQTFYHTIRRPHYPFLYGQFLDWTGHFPAMMIQHFLVLACAAMFYFMGRSAAGRASGLVSGILVSCYGGFVLYAHSIMSETLFNFFLVCHLAFLFIGIKRESSGYRDYMFWFFMAGLLAGIAANVRPVIQYQVAVLCLVLFPFYHFRRAWGSFLRLAVFMVFGFLLVYLYVAGATYRHYGLFGLSAGLPKAVMYRLVDNPGAPLSGVKTSDPVTAAIRDYLSEVGDDDDVIWLHAYGHIGRNILPKFITGRPVTLLDVDKAVMKLWKQYVATYPFKYSARSMHGLKGTFGTQDTFSGLWEFSNEMFIGEYKKLPDEVVSGISNFYSRLSNIITSRVLFFIVLVLTLRFLACGKGTEIMFMACLIASMFFLFVPQFFASVGIPRYRYPFDMVYFLVIGVIFPYPMAAAREWAMAKIAPGGGK